MAKIDIKETFFDFSDKASVYRCKMNQEQYRLTISCEKLDDLMILRCNRDLIPVAIEKLRTE